MFRHGLRVRSRATTKIPSDSVDGPSFNSRFRRDTERGLLFAGRLRERRWSAAAGDTVVPRERHGQLDQCREQPFRSTQIRGFSPPVLFKEPADVAEELPQDYLQTGVIFPRDVRLIAISGGVSVAIFPKRAFL